MDSKRSEADGGRQISALSPGGSALCGDPDTTPYRMPNVMPAAPVHAGQQPLQLGQGQVYLGHYAEIATSISRSLPSCCS